jgi:hypothetical protein
VVEVLDCVRLQYVIDEQGEPKALFVAENLSRSEPLGCGRGPVSDVRPPALLWRLLRWSPT